MREFFEVLERHTDTAIFIAFFIYMLFELVISNLRHK